MFHAITKLRVRCLDWIEEFDSFPLFAKVGGMRFAKGDMVGRANTIRRTIKLMRTDRRSLVIFPEGVLHRPNDLLPFGRSLQTIATKVSGVTMVPVAIKYEMSMHERPEAWVSFGESHPFESLQECEAKLQAELQLLNNRILANHDFEVLATGTASVNERMSMKSLRRK
jgi:1-acyl-sn-glycerol-3-phosphate acyltransferase